MKKWLKAIECDTKTMVRESCGRSGQVEDEGGRLQIAGKKAKKKKMYLLKDTNFLVRLSGHF